MGAQECEHGVVRPLWCEACERAVAEAAKVRERREAMRAAREKLRRAVVRDRVVAALAVKSRRAFNAVERKAFGGVSVGATLSNAVVKGMVKVVDEKKTVGEARDVLKHIGAGFDYAKVMGEFSRLVLEAMSDGRLSVEEASRVNESVIRVVEAAARLNALKGK